MGSWASRVPLVTDLTLPGRDIHIGRPNSDGLPRLSFPNPNNGMHTSILIHEVFIPVDERRETSFAENTIDPDGSFRHKKVTVTAGGEITIYETGPDSAEK